MVRFEDNRLVIEIQTDTRKYAVEKWLALQKEILYLTRWTTSESISQDFYVLPDLLEDLLLDWEQAIKMVEE